MNGVSLNDYRVNSQVDFGSQDPSVVSELIKAMSAGEITGMQTVNRLDTSGAPLKVESLESTLTIITYTEKDIVMWKKVVKKPATNTVEEYNQLVSYGQEGGVFNREGQLPRTADSVYRRKAVLVKYMGITREVTHPMQLVTTMVGDILRQETENGTQFMLREADRALAWADSKDVMEEFDGFYALHRAAFTTNEDYFNSEIVIDARGKTLSDGMVQDASLGINLNYGWADTIVGPPIVFSNYVQKYYPAKLISPNTTQVTAGVMGQKVNQIQTQFGLVDILIDRFWAMPLPRMATDPATNLEAPAAPIADGTAPAALVSDPLSKFVTEEAGDYYYAVAAKNMRGESALTKLGSAALAVVVGQSVDLKFTAGGGANPASSFVIYRTTKNGSADGPYYPIFTVSVQQLTDGYDGGAQGVVRDRDYIMAGTERAFLFEQSEKILAFKQLAPLMKMNLAVLSPSTRFMILLYGACVLYAPKKVAMICNIGTSDLNVKA